MKPQYVYIILLFLLGSCQREQIVDLEVPHKRKLVASLFLRADANSASAYLTHTTPVFGTEPRTDPAYVTTGSGYIRNPGSAETWSFVYDSQDLDYKTSLDPATFRPGQQYEVSFSDEYETVTGTTTVPYPVAASVSVKIDSVMEFGSYTYNVTVTCTILSEGSFYVQLSPVILFEDGSVYPMYASTLERNIRESVKGQSFSQKYTAPFASEFIRPTEVQVMLISCDKTYAGFYNSSGEISFDDLGPITEPSFAYSNMSNGVGVFASYTISDTYTFPVR
jgi:hypothetical protein